jgi:outer membrane protein assembly factor BamB
MKTAYHSFFAALVLSGILRFGAKGQNVVTPSAPTTLPGNGLAQHDFFYAGEGNKNMSIIKKGRIVWSFTDTTSRGEISDAILLSNGNVLFAHQFGITEIDRNKNIVWHYEAPPGTEIHTAEPIGLHKVLYIQNGNPAKLVVFDIRSGKVNFEMDMQVANLLSIHGQFRHASITDAGTVLVAHMDQNKVCEYNSAGKMIWQVDVQSPWDAERLKNGHTLISSNGKFVREVNNNGETVWEFTAADMPEIKFSGMQRASRLPNGNTVINNWAGKGDGTAVQAIEIGPNKKLVWALRAWTPPADLGRSTTIQILDDPAVITEQGHFGKIK